MKLSGRQFFVILNGHHREWRIKPFSASGQQFQLLQYVAFANPEKHFSVNTSKK
jgi:hypothetical protein